jgi:rubrerythrin
VPAFTAAHAFGLAMQIEKNGEAFYRAALAKTADPQVKMLFLDLAVQEQRHHAVFEEMAGKLGAAPMDVDEEYLTYAQVALDHALFGGPDKALALAAGAQDRRLALQAAIGFEKDTLLFFYDLRDLAGEDDRPTLSAIISEEKGHLHRLASMLS